MKVLGIDPGSEWTGIVIRSGRDLLHTDLLNRADGADMDAWLDAVQLAIHDGLRLHSDAWVAVEGVVHPSPHMGLTNVGPILDTAQVLGCIRTHWESSVIRPKRHGRCPKALLDIKGKPGRERCRQYLLANYPPELVGSRVYRGESDDQRHLRAAWDVAGAGMSVQRRFGVTA